MCRWLLMMHDRAEGETLTYTHEFLANILRPDPQICNAGSAIDAKCRSYQLSSRHDASPYRAGLEKASCECYAIVRKRFDAFLTPPSTAVHGHTKGRRKHVSA